MLNWDDFRIFLSVHRAGGLVGAARRLGVDHTTVARRLSALEASLGAQLVDRSPRGARLTEAGRALLEHAERIEGEALAAGAEVGAIRAEVAGAVRLATPEAFGTWLVAPNVRRLREAHPALQIELVPEARRVSLTKREADLAVTLARPPQGAWWRASSPTIDWVSTRPGPISRPRGRWTTFAICRAAHSSGISTN